MDIGFVYDNDNLLGMKEIVELLNMLHEENQQLKHWNKCLAEKRHQELKGDVE